MGPQKRFSKALPLSPGDVISIIAPGSGFKREPFRRTVKWLENRGYDVSYREDVFERQDYLAGDDDRRLAEWHYFWEDSKPKAIFCARGGYGAMRLLEKAGEDLLPQSRKIFMGYSDATVLLNYVAWKKGFPTVHGPLMAAESFLNLPAKLRDKNFGLLEEAQPQILRSPKDFSIQGKRSFRGKLWGGNLSMMASVLGTPYFPEVDQGILFLEEVNEPKYRIDRLFAQLSLAGVLEKVSGLIFGDFTDEKKRLHKDTFLKEMLERYFDLNKKTCLTGVRAGHRRQDVWLPIGGVVEFNFSSKKLELSSFVSSARQ